MRNKSVLSGQFLLNCAVFCSWLAYYGWNETTRGLVPRIRTLVQIFGRLHCGNGDVVTAPGPHTPWTQKQRCAADAFTQHRLHEKSLIYIWILQNVSSMIPHSTEQHECVPHVWAILGCLQTAWRAEKAWPQHIIPIETHLNRNLPHQSPAFIYFPHTGNKLAAGMLFTWPHILYERNGSQEHAAVTWTGRDPRPHGPAQGGERRPRPEHPPLPRMYHYQIWSHFKPSKHRKSK